MKKRIAILLSIVMLVALLPTNVLAFTNTHSAPTFNPQNDHPRVMFTQGDIPTIQANFSASQNAAAYARFQEIISDPACAQTITKSNFSNTDPYYNHTLENMIEALAFDYAINGTAQSANLAITRELEYLAIVSSKNSEEGLAYRYFGTALFHAAEIFDWCYNYSGFTQSQKDTMIGYCDKILKYLDTYENNSIDKQGGITGHGAENQILRDILAYGIATWKHTTASGNSRNDIYNMVMGKIQDEFVPVRNEIYKSGTVFQGSEYGWYRFTWDLYAEILVERMKQYNKVTLFNTDDMKNALYGMIYSRRPDGRFFQEGDNKNSHWYYYNKFNMQTAKLAGDLFNDPYFKGEYRMMNGDTDDFTNQNFTDARSFNAVLWLIMNNPEVDFIKGTQGGRSPLPKSKYFGSPMGKIYAKTNWAYSKDGKSAGVAAAEMKIGEHFGANHDHLDTGTFQLYYGGLLTGDYGAQDDYGSSFDVNYYKRTVAHNAITIYDSSESWVGKVDGDGLSRANDGGQLSAYETNSFSSWLNSSPYKRATVVNHSIAEDNSYSYIKGDITAAYNSSKASEVARSMAFLPTNNGNAPAVMVVFDKVTSKSSSQTKKFLLHTAKEPTVTNNNKIVYTNDSELTYSSSNVVTCDGKLTVNTLLPESATITKIAGTKTNGTAYNATQRTESKYEPEWGRVEIQASSEGTTTTFLNVLIPSGTSYDPEDAEIIGSENTALVGAKTPFNQVIMFANTGKDSLSSGASFTVDGEDENVKIFIFGLDDGRWTVKKDGARVGVYDVAENDGALALTGDSGTYSVAPYNAATDRNDAIVCWYDYRMNDGMDVDDKADSWTDLSSAGNDMPISLTGNTYWKVTDGNLTGLRIQGESSNATVLPENVKNALNGNSFTFEFFVSDINQRNSEECISLFGDVKKNFAIYKIIGANKIYLKMPGTKTIVRRMWWYKDYDSETHSIGIDGHHCVITLDRTSGALKLYVDGNLVKQTNYTTSTAINDVSLVTESGNSAVYKQIKVFNIALDAEEVMEEYNAYLAGPQ